MARKKPPPSIEDPKPPRKTKRKAGAADLECQADPQAPLDSAAFLAAAQPVLALLRADLLARADEHPAVGRALAAQHEAERAAGRTADSLLEWRERTATQVAAAWLLSCVFVRTLEDRGLVATPRLAGPGAMDSQRLFFELAPSLSERDYLLFVFRELAGFPAARDLFDREHSLIWRLLPSADAARALVDLFRAPHADAPAFRFGQASTRFLGDLYQDLDEGVRKRYALLQTPDFIETYILDHTLEPALERFGLGDTTLIDPTCGSGHLLLGAFARLFAHQRRAAPGLGREVAAQAALGAVFGADVNPYAVAIARFRLTLAYLEAAGHARLADAPALPLHLVVADSLLHNPHAAQLDMANLAAVKPADFGGELFALEDQAAARDVLHRQYAAVVGNPPYITVKDEALRDRYRAMYPRSAFRSYSLAAPFCERVFQLARPRGLVGQITANSFMKREFGRKLIEDFLPTVNLTRVVNTSGAFIPGHGTPTVLLFGSAEPPVGTEVLTVLAKRGEPSTPADPARGLVWTSITEHGAEVGFDNDYISVARLERSGLTKHPWSLGGGGALELKELLEERAEKRLEDLGVEIGTGAVTREDAVYLLDRGVLDRWRIPEGNRRIAVEGENIRDWSIAGAELALWPYDPASLDPVVVPEIEMALWPWRTQLSQRVAFGKTQMERGLPWTAYSMFFASRARTPLSIAFAEVATHNHFVLDRGGKVFKQTAPIIKLPATATEDDHLALLAYLNSSTACFWMKQVCFPKGTTTGDISVEKGKLEANRYAFSGTAISPLPLPTASIRAELIALGARASELATSREELSATSVVERVAAGEPRARVLADVERQRDEIQTELVRIQEDLDWLVYRAFDLTGDRAAAGPEIAIIEQPVYKRQWSGRQGVFGHGVMSFADSVVDAARVWLQDRAEAILAREAAPLSRAALLRTLATDPGCRAILAEILSTDPDQAGADLTDSWDSVPFLAAQRMTEPGLAKHAEWQRTWDVQRAEDRGDKVMPGVPPKYVDKDFASATIWRLRGKLDVPKERFISYPGCESDEDGEPVYGWAGWDHLQRAQALAALYMKRKTDESWPAARLTPMLAGLHELLPWLRQWHNDPSADFGGLRMADYFADFLAGELSNHALTEADLLAWRPSRRTRGSKPRRPPDR